MVNDTDAPLLRKADALVGKLEDWLTALAAAVIMFIMCFATVQVLVRKCCKLPWWVEDEDAWFVIDVPPVWGFIDITEIIMVAFAFLSIAYCQRLGGHIRMELLVRRLKGRTLWIAEFIGVLAAFIIIVLLMMFGWDFFMRAYELGDSTIDRDLPIWPAKLIIPVAFFVLCLRLIVQMWAYLRLAGSPDAEPIAIPVLEEFEEIAKQEIEGALGNDARATNGGSN